MRTPSRPAPRWSKRVDALVEDVAGTWPPGLRSDFGRWVHSSARFQALVEAHQSKLRKKVSSANNADARLDVRAEMLVAYLLLRDRRFEVALETFGARHAGPDLTVTYRGNWHLGLEVTRLRAADGHDRIGLRLASVIAAKLRQVVPTIPNLLVIVADGLADAETGLDAASRLLRAHAESKDDAFFARRGLRDARDFLTRYQHLGAVFARSGPADASVWINRQARHPLPSDAVHHLLTCLGDVSA